MKRLKRSCSILIVLFGALNAVAAFDIDIGLALDINSENPTNVAPVISVGGFLQTTNFDFVAELLLKRDGKYAAPEPQFGEFYLVMNQAGIRFHEGSVSLEGGRFDVVDEFRGPYSLFLSSVQQNPLTGQIAYDDGVFYYKTRWIGLNYDSALYRVEYPVDPDGAGPLPADGTMNMPLDRGVNYKTYGLRLGDGFRLAYQESSIYTGRYFDTDFFLNPLPGYFVQYINNAGGSPWTQQKPWGAFDNSNYLMGILFDYTGPTTWLGLQFLIDDINLNRFLNPSGPQNPDKIALSLGWQEILPDKIGTLGVYAALATKYLFQPFSTEPGDQYGYTWYPTTRYESGTGWQGISAEDNYIGYLNGENNLAFTVDYRTKIEQLDLYGRLEYKITGSQSPSNPWHNYVNWYEGGQGAHWLDDPRLEHKVRLWIEGEYPIGELTIMAKLMGGFVVNELELTGSTETFTGVTNSEFMYLYIPGTTSRLLGQFFLGVKYSFKI